MNDSADEPPLSNRIRSWARSKTHASSLNPLSGADDHHPAPALDPSTPSPDNAHASLPLPASNAVHTASTDRGEKDNQERDVVNGNNTSLPTPPAPAVAEKREGEESSAIDQEPKLPVSKRFLNETKRIVYSSWINWLLLFVPVGIAIGIIHKVKGDASPISPTVIFAINAVAIIPLASLLSFATESVASKMGDTIGALMNVTFGNAVELIIFIIALVAKEVRIVQASLLGSILANLLLILGMCFLFGGLRFREQLYNSAVSQMSACLLSLSVISLLLPTAFHASFSNSESADKVVVKVSRGTSVVLLFVYILYLLFQLKSHAYMYESTPQHLIDEESHPGVLAEMLNSSSSSDSSSSSSDSDTDSSSGSHTTAKRIKRALRRKRRKSTTSSKETPAQLSIVRTPSSHTHVMGNDDIPTSESPKQLTPKTSRNLDTVFSGDEADTDGERDKRHGSRSTGTAVTARDFEGEANPGRSVEKSSKKKKSKKSKYSKRGKKEEEKTPVDHVSIRPVESNGTSSSAPQVGFLAEVQFIPDPAQGAAAKRSFNLRNLAVRPALPKALASNVFSSQPAPAEQALPPPTSTALPTYESSNNNIRRTISLPEMIHQPVSNPQPAPISAQPLPHLMPANQSVASVDSKDLIEGKKHLSKTTSVILLLVSTGLVAVCAEFLVDSIDYMVKTTGVSQAFIGLIVLPIVGNAAEHVTAVTVASKNKMDLAIGVALGSSIQIAIFVTPVIVLLGWALKTDMSLYFSLFETVSLFASAFMVNYLMIDGRSNYLEGALLIAAYIIIAVAAFFYPTCDLSLASGPVDSNSC